MGEQAAGDIAFVIESAVAAHGGARIALPGGRTPATTYQSLLKTKLDWSKVTVVPTDDRLVASGSPLSNFDQLQAAFGSKGANVVPLADASSLDDYREAGRLADAQLAGIGWPLDLVVLGMGTDGHTASIFPGPDFDRAIAGPKERRAVGVRPDPMPPEAPVDRVTLTAAALSSARAIMVLIAGDEKKQVLERALEEGPLSTKAIGRVVAEIDAPVDIFWSAE
jgi:6-phosphogluconolactonase